MAADTQIGTIPARGFDWDDVRFPAKRVGNFAALRYGKALKAANRIPGDVPVFGTNGRTGWHNDVLVDGPGVILGRKGQGHLGVKWCRSPFWVIDTAYYADLHEDIDARWFYFVTNYVGLDHLKSGPKPGLNRDVFCRQLFPFPDPDEQQAIGRVLGQLDDKIFLNRRMNRTLEAAARTIFRSWFVDFDPVVAKVDGRQPDHMSPQTAALFPEHFEESDVDPIPLGWSRGTTADIAQYVNGRNFTKNATGTGRMVIRIAELNSGPGGSTVYNDVQADPVNTAYPDDILFAWSGSLDVYRWHRDEALINQHIFKVICADYPEWFVYFHLQEAMPFFQHVAAGKATTMGHIKRSHLAEPSLALPTGPLLKRGTEAIQPLYDRIHRNHRESMTLAGIRDALLPELLSGEIRVRQAERAIAEVCS